MRVGFGYDVHPLVAGRKLILGGVEVFHTKGLAGHSDADALVHAVGDALLGAMGEGDLGKHYPSSDPQYKDIASLRLLEDITGKLTKKGFRLVNVDSTIIAQAPRLGSHLEEMAVQLAKALGVQRAMINVKVKSGEGVGSIGREEAIAVQAACLIEYL